MNSKKYTTIQNPEIIERILSEISKRVHDDYFGLVEYICDALRTYYYSLPKTIDTEGKEIIPKFIIGISGGIDSAVVAYCAVRAVGAKHIIAVTMPAGSHDKVSSLRAYTLQKALALPYFYSINIRSTIRSAIKALNASHAAFLPMFSRERSECERMRVGNIASRIRISLLYDIQKSCNGRVLGTGNRTEYVQGYAAKYGTPISCDFGVLDDLYKVDIVKLARILQVPQEIIQATPSTGYYAGQTHEAELGATLAEQDCAAFLLFEKNMNIASIVKEYGISKEYLLRMQERYMLSEHKRKLQQPHIKIIK